MDLATASCFLLAISAAFLAAARVFFRGRLEIALEILAMRQQVAFLKRKRPRPALSRLDRFFWIALRRLWPSWAAVLANFQEVQMKSNLHHLKQIGVYERQYAMKQQFGNPDEL